MIVVHAVLQIDPDKRDDAIDVTQFVVDEASDPNADAAVDGA